METRGSYRLSFDQKRRTTWPAQLLAEAGVTTDDELIAHRDAEGRLVVETRKAIERRVLQRAATERARAGYEGSLAEELLAERRADRSLD